MKIFINGVSRDATQEEINELVLSTTRTYSEQDVIRERIRRLSAGFDFNFHDSRGIHHIGTTEQDMEGWDEVTKLAQVALNMGQTTYPINIKTNTGSVTVTATEWQQILLAAGLFRQPIFAKSFALQTMNPIPQDYTDNKWW